MGGGLEHCSVILFLVGVGGWGLGALFCYSFFGGGGWVGAWSIVLLFFFCPVAKGTGRPFRSNIQQGLRSRLLLTSHSWSYKIGS